jgi:adenine-specific DNA-methyltransferase
MNKIEATDAEAQSADIVANNLSQLKSLFPEAFAEGKVQFETLRQLLGDAVDEADEKYGLNWHGKRRARQIALTPSTGTLRPCPDESVDWDTTQNLMIEGDNLEVLKLLQKSYSGQLKLIYIDPPYNTGSDFVYPDDFRNGIGNYLELTGQTNEGVKITANQETSGRFHTDWLNMMYPRVRLARSLLRKDGVIFISIGDDELDNLLKICNEIFGEENYCGSFIWEKKKKPSFLSSNMGTVMDYIICFAREKSMSPPFVAGAVEDGKKYPFNNAGNGIQTLTFKPNSVCFSMSDQTIKARDMSEGNIKTELLDDLVIVGGRNQNTFRLRGEWRYSQSKLDEFIAENAEIVISKIPFRPNYINRSGESKKTANLLSYRTNGVPTNEDATEEMRSIFGQDVISYPKPSGLLKYLVRTVTVEGDIVCDFFSGSGTTAHGTWLQRIEDSQNRRFILVQLPEALDPAKPEQQGSVRFCDSIAVPRTIAELTKERLRRTGKKLRDEYPNSTLDYGFRVFKLDASNIRLWNPNRENVSQSLLDHHEHVLEGRTEADIVYELLLKLGLDLCVPIESRTVAGKTIGAVGGGVLMLCLAEKILASEVEAVAAGIVSWHKELAPTGDSTVVFRDSAFADDVAKTNMAAILAQNDLENVRSL